MNLTAQRGESDRPLHIYTAILLPIGAISSTVLLTLDSPPDFVSVSSTLRAAINILTETAILVACTVGLARRSRFAYWGAILYYGAPATLTFLVLTVIGSLEAFSKATILSKSPWFALGLIASLLVLILVATLLLSSAGRDVFRIRPNLFGPYRDTVI